MSILQNKFGLPTKTFWKVDGLYRRREKADPAPLSERNGTDGDLSLWKTSMTVRVQVMGCKGRLHREDRPFTGNAGNVSARRSSHSLGGNSSMFAKTKGRNPCYRIGNFSSRHWKQSLPEGGLPCPPSAATSPVERGHWVCAQWCFRFERHFALNRRSFQDHDAWYLRECKVFMQRIEAAWVYGTCMQKVV